MSFKNSKTLLLTVFLLLGGKLFVLGANAQEQPKLELSLIPSIGFNFSYSQLAKGYIRKDLVYTNLYPARDFYWGLGLQANYNNDWIVSMILCETGIGGGFRAKDQRISSTASASTDGLLLNIEKGLFETKPINILKQKVSYKFNLLWGVGINWIPKPDRIKIEIRKDIFGIYTIRTSSPVNDISGNVTIGFTNVIQINKKSTLKLGAIYTYGLAPSMRFDYQLTYTYLPKNPEENFSIYTGRHRMLLFLEYPIILYKNKAQKSYYAN